LATRRDDRRRKGFRRHNKNICEFCVDGIKIDYKNAEFLRGFLTNEGKILPRRRTGTCPKHQRHLTRAIKRARHLALLAHAPQHTYQYG